MKSKTCRLSILLFISLSLLPVCRGGELRAGLARVEITPTLPVMLGGYASRKDLSKGVHDPLSARAVAFTESGQRLVLVSIDNLGFYNDTAEPMRQAVLQACGLKPSELFLCAIHTHSAPILALDSAQGHSNNVAYTQELRGKLVAVVQSALQGLEPAQVGAGTGASPVGSNRRQVVPDTNGQAKIILGRNPTAAIDREVQVLKITRPGGTGSVGALFAFATHSTSLGPGNYLVSGDVHGTAEQFLERYLGAGVVAPGFAGASGDIDPWYRVLPGFKATNGWVPETVLLGTLLAEETAHVLDDIRTFTAQGPVRTLLRDIELPVQPRGESTEAPGKSSIKLTVGQVGQVAFVGLGGEVFNEIGQVIKARSPFQHTFVLTHCNGASGYVPTASAYPEGGYEVQSSPFTAGAGERLATEAVRALKDLATTP